MSFCVKNNRRKIKMFPTTLPYSMNAQTLRPLTDEAPSALLTVSTRTLMRLLDCGKPAAVRIGTEAGARITIGRKILWNVQAVRRYLDSIAE